MCLAVPGQILSIDGTWADVDIMGLVNKVNIQLLERPAVGDYILIHTGFAIEKINKDYFNFLQKELNNLLALDDENE